MKINKTQLAQIIKEELGKVLNEREVFTYNGDAQELIDHAVAQGWKFEGDKYDADGYIDWDIAMDEATAFLKSQGWEIDYNTEPQSPRRGSARGVPGGISDLDIMVQDSLSAIADDYSMPLDAIRDTLNRMIEDAV